jgi:hypothetical protein
MPERYMSDKTTASTLWAPQHTGRHSRAAHSSHGHSAGLDGAGASRPLIIVAEGCYGMFETNTAMRIYKYQRMVW